MGQVYTSPPRKQFLTRSNQRIKSKIRSRLRETPLNLATDYSINRFGVKCSINPRGALEAERSGWEGKRVARLGGFLCRPTPHSATFRRTTVNIPAALVFSGAYLARVTHSSVSAGIREDFEARQSRIPARRRVDRPDVVSRSTCLLIHGCHAGCDSSDEIKEWIIFKRTERVLGNSGGFHWLVTRCILREDSGGIGDSCVSGGERFVSNRSV